MLVEGLPQQALDDRLPADVQLSRRFLQLLEHAGGEIDVDALNRVHHPAAVGEKPRDVFALVGEPRNRLRRRSPPPLTSFLHKAVAPVVSLSTVSRAANTPLARPP